MDYETFKQEMTEDLKQRLYERGIEDVEMSFHNVEKANQSYESLTVRQEGSNVGVNFNIEKAFTEYEHTGDYAGVLAESTHAIMQGQSKCKFGMFGLDSSAPKGWNYVNLGMGNHLIVRDDMIAPFMERIGEDAEPSEVYMKWMEVAEEILSKNRK